MSNKFTKHVLIICFCICLKVTFAQNGKFTGCNKFNARNVLMSKKTTYLTPVYNHQKNGQPKVTSTDAKTNQKMVYIPLYLQNINDTNGAQFSWSKTAQSLNFILIWGNTVGTNPATYSNTALAFNPTSILDTLEFIYQKYKAFGFLDDTIGTNMNIYKIPVIIHNTWGPNGSMGWAEGSDADGVIGAFWVHPGATHDGGTMSHELAHSLQAQCQIDYRAAHGLGSVWDNAGIFWETHAEFMSTLLYPQNAVSWGMDQYSALVWGDWKNTYANYQLLYAIMESEGIGMINKLWRESYSFEYPLNAYKRLGGYNQQQFNNKIFEYARRMPTHDFTFHNVGNFLRQKRSYDLQNNLATIQSVYTILQQDVSASTHFYAPVEFSPEEYGYNIIPIYPNLDSCAVIIKFKGHTELNGHAGWRYGFVAADGNGIVTRYGNTYSDISRDLAFSLLPGESKMYFVVMGAPADSITTNQTNDTWHGYPKHFRFPYDLTISGGLPEGFQPAANFRSQLKINGHLHANGGGWVDNNSFVASTVYVAPYSIVSGNSTINGSVSIMNTSLVHDADISGSVTVTGNAFVNGGTYSDNSIISGLAFAENDTMTGTSKLNMRAHVSNYKLGGSIEVGGDVVVYNDIGDCSNGVYYRMTNYYENNLLECDGRSATHPDNLDVNNAYVGFSANQMVLTCNCTFVPDCELNAGVQKNYKGSSDIEVFPNPAHDILNIKTQSTDLTKYELVDLTGRTLILVKDNLPQFSLNISALKKGVYFLNIVDNKTGSQTVKKVIKQ